MEENQNPISQSEVSTQEDISGSSNVSFPTVGQPKKGGSGKTFLIIGTLILVAILGFVIFKSAGNKEIESTEPTPIQGVTDEITATPTPSASASPKAISRSGVSIEVQNGTGITGDAAYLQNQLKTLGYTDVKTANATGANVTATKVTFAKSLSQEVVDELTKKLKELYTTVDTTTSTSGTINVVIITGLKKGATALPSGTATPKPSTTPTGSASPSASPTTTPSST